MHYKYIVTKEKRYLREYGDAIHPEIIWVEKERDATRLSMIKASRYSRQFACQFYKEKQ